MTSKGSLIDAFNHVANKYADAAAVIENRASHSFLDLKIASDKCAVGLLEKGVKKGDRIALYCINSVQFAIAYMGIVKTGAAVVPINLLQKPSEITYVMNNAGISGLIYHELFQAQVDEAVPELNISVFELRISNDAEQSVAWDSAFKNDGVLPPIEIDADNDLVAILYTSGTTGHPKGAMLTHTNLVSNTASVFRAMKWQAGKDIVALVLPMFHAFAATVGMLTPLTHGCSFVPIAKFEPDNLLSIIDQTQATIFLGVPSMYNVLLNTKDEKTHRFDSIKLCISGGASMPVDVMKRFEEKFNVGIYEGDGPTECSPVTCVNPIGGIRKIGTVGLPVPNVEMKILDEQGNEVPLGDIGEIAVRGPSVMKGYWNLDEATTESFHDGWFLTGDLGNEDEDGYFSILDRKKDMVIVNGMNVYPRIIEEVLYRYDLVLEAAVIGHIDKLHGEIPVAYIVLKEGATADSADIRSWCRQHLGSYEVPRKVVFMDELPKNGAGKIVKRVLNKQGEVERGIT
ncbi:MAG TPA: long-chain fatty acid--CoA ligase [Cycloclasticus sp.]|jgi:long-chain acyl-CoA synthetase|nr:long-chain fatty acid--CoA ligase [Cycloclasticus sp.]HIL91556.1 long-chain fatty acid--CoA ligase [Cycloclasticus sp.]